MFSGLLIWYGTMLFGMNTNVQWSFTRDSIEDKIMYKAFIHMDNLAEISDGDYIHFQLGSKTDSNNFIYGSVFRTASLSDSLYTYRARYLYGSKEKKTQLLIRDETIKADTAKELFAKLKRIGILELRENNGWNCVDQPQYMCIRVRIGDSTLEIDEKNMSWTDAVFRTIKYGRILLALRELVVTRKIHSDIEAR